MPPIEVYRVNFASGNLTPSLDLPGWGDIRHGSSDGTVATPQPPPEPDPGGLYLRLVRESGDIANQKATANSLYVVLPPPAVSPPDRSLPLYTRLRMSVAFDLPRGAPLDVTDAPPAGSWAVVTAVKFGNQQDLQDEKFVAVTCQFNPKKNGVRLNTPGGLQKDDATVLDSPLGYGKYQAGCLGLWGANSLCSEPLVLRREGPSCGSWICGGERSALDREQERRKDLFERRAIHSSETAESHRCTRSIAPGSS